MTKEIPRQAPLEESETEEKPAARNADESDNEHEAVPTEDPPVEDDKRGASGDDLDPRLIPTAWKAYSKTLKCTHGIKLPKRGDGHRNHRFVRYTNCTAQVNATLVKNKRGEYCIFLKPKGSHNHALSRELWEYYAENCRIRDASLLQTVGDMRQSGSSAKGILAYLRKRTGKKSSLREFHNMLQSIQSDRRGATSEATRSEDVLREFVEQEHGNAASIFVDEGYQVAHVVMFQSARMRRLFQAFPEVVMVDTTHGTNANQYKLFSLAVTDFFGKGQYVQHALVKAETKANLRLAIECFQRNNPSWSKIKVFVTDKAFHEKAVLAERFSDSRQLLCTFHVVTWLEKQAGRLSFGSSQHKDKLKATLSSLVTTTSTTQYEQGKAYLLQLLDGNPNHDLYRTFMDNWDGCRAEWVLYKRGNVPHLGNHTNNKLESKWGEIKQVVSKDESIDELVTMLILLQEVAENDYLREYHRVGSCPQLDENPELAALEMTLSPFAYDLVAAEFYYASGGRADYAVQTTSGMFRLESRRTGTEHSVNNKMYSCDCFFRQTYLLPCGHIMFISLQNLCETVLPPYNSIARRWMRGCAVNDIGVGDVGGGDVTLQSIQRVPQKKALNGDDKYMKAKERMEKIVSVLTVQSTPTFKTALTFLDGFAGTLHEGRLTEFAAGFSPHELAIVKMESVTSSTTSETKLETLSQTLQPAHTQIVVATESQSRVPPRKNQQESGSNFTFTPPPKSPGLSRKQKRQAERAIKIRDARAEVKQHAEEVKPVTFEDIQTLLADQFSWSTVRSSMEELKLKVCDVEGDVEVRLQQPGEHLPVITSMLNVEKIEEAKACIRFDDEETGTYVAFWEAFGCIAHDQLLVMERIITVKQILRGVGFTLDWIEGVAWREADFQAVQDPFGDEHMMSKVERKGAVMSMPLGTKYLHAEATSGASLLVYPEDMWLNLTCMISGMFYLQCTYPGVDVVNPSFYHCKNPADQIKLASAFRPFGPSNRRIIGVLNVTNAVFYTGKLWIFVIE